MRDAGGGQGVGGRPHWLVHEATEQPPDTNDDA
jgi:hypothetical protein